MHAIILLFATIILRSFCSSDEQDVVDCILKGCSEADVQCMLKAQREISKWLQINNLNKVLVVGKTGTGKTRLVEGFAKNIPEVGEDDDKNLFSKTLEVRRFQYIYEGLKIDFYDSPGLVDTEGGEEGIKKNYEYLTNMERSVSPDVVVFFVRMDQFQESLDEEDKRVIRNVSDTFGSSNWRYTMFVLSFANKVKNDDAKERGDEDDQYYFTVKHAQMSLQIKKFLRKLQVNKNVTNEIPLVPVGLVSEEQFVADARDVSWVKEFWSNLFKILIRMKKDKRNQLKPENDESLVDNVRSNSWLDRLFWFWK